MDFINFSNASFYYLLQDELNEDGLEKTSETNAKKKYLFQDFSADFPPSFVSIVGPNGSGKSTFMLLASGRLLPTSGNIHLFGIDTKTLTNEEERNLTSTFIYQNMELETEEKVQDLVSSIFEKGGHDKKNIFLIQEIIDAFSLNSILGKKLKQLSKGEMQRCLIAFSILYGTRSIFMDEPIFALEYQQKEDALSYIKSYSQKFQVPVYIAMHELELTKKWADNVLLIFPNRDMSFGSPDEVLIPEDLEKAYGFPSSLLKESERLTQKNLLELQTEIDKDKSTG